MTGTLRRACAAAVLSIPMLALPTAAQAPPRVQQPRVAASFWGGAFTSFDGFVDPALDEFFNFDASLAYGGGLHVRINEGVVLGVNGIYSKPDYARSERTTGEQLAGGEATVTAALASARLLTGGGGALGLYLSLGIGAFAYDVPELGGRDVDFALEAGAGLEYLFSRHFAAFLEFGQFWVWHQAAGDAQNRANHNLLRLGARAGT